MPIKSKLKRALHVFVSKTSEDQFLIFLNRKGFIKLLATLSDAKFGEISFQILLGRFFFIISIFLINLHEGAVNE